MIEIPLKVSRYRLREIDHIVDNANDIYYTIGGPSSEYMLYVISYLKSDRGLYAINQFHGGYWFSDDAPASGSSILEFLSSSSEFSTLRVYSMNSKSYTRLLEYARSMSYEIAYNIESDCLIVPTLSEYFSEPALKSVERGAENVSHPKRNYKTQLLEYYSHALMSQNPASRFLSFYNVIEFFFSASVIDEGISDIRKMINRTGFSSKNNDHMKEILRYIVGRYTSDGDSLLRGTKENDSLKATLRKHVSLGDIIPKLSPEEFQYYSATPVAFSDGVPIDFGDDDRFIETLSQRIYATRNSVVHSKEDNQKKYMPSRDRNIILKEMTIMKSVAEAIIESTSEELIF